MKHISPYLNHTYESKKGHVYSSNKIIFFKDSTFIYYQSGPSVTYSCGNWKYSAEPNKLELISNIKKCQRKVGNDSLFIDVNEISVEFKSSKELLINGIRFWID